MESTYLYYGKYSQDDRSYQMAVAYFFVIFCCFAFSLVSLVIHSAKYIKQGFRFHEQNSNQYFTLVYCNWDFSVNSQTSAKIKSVKIERFCSFDFYIISLVWIHQRHQDCSFNRLHTEQISSDEIGDEIDSLLQESFCLDDCPGHHWRIHFLHHQTF